MQRTGGARRPQWMSWMLVVAVAAAGCGGEVDGKLDDGSVVDRPIDSPDDPPIDAPPIDARDPTDAPVDAAGCGTDVLLTGYYLDWDSTLATPMGIGGSRWTVIGDASRQADSQPSGVVSLCIAPAGISQLTVTGPGYVPARFVADPAVFAPPNTRFIIRGLQSAGPNDAAAQYAEFGETYNAGRAHVLVYNLGQPIPLALAPDLIPPQPSFISGGNFNDITWTAGTTGKLTLFPNRPTNLATANLVSPMGFTGPTEVPLVGGALTMVVIRSSQ